MRWEGQLTYMEERKGAYRVLVGKTMTKTTLGRPKRR